MDWEEFIAQHGGLQTIKEFYNLTDSQIKDACVKCLVSLVIDKKIDPETIDCTDGAEYKLEDN